MVERFFFFSTNSRTTHDDPIILLSGPPSSGKTSLLFQFAFNFLVNDADTSAVFICSRRTKPPFLSKGVDPSSNVFDRIQIKYVEDEEGINKFFAAFHMHDKFPVLVIIDDFGEFFDERICQQRYHSPRGRELAIVRTLALCRNAIDHANETGTCMLLLSDTHHGDTPKFLHIYKRWVNSIYTIKGDGIGSFNIMSNGPQIVRTTAAKYSVALQYLVLEEMYENEEQRKIT
ncbi:putative P-loop containing nucleoside triphosphate hydrolase [Helianthus anomalus]